jgi:hypothetical protein
MNQHREVIACLLRAGRKDLAGAVAAPRMSREDRKPAGSVEFETSNGRFRAVVGPVHPRWKVRPVELYRIQQDGPEEFVGYAAPAKLENLGERYAEGLRAIKELRDRRMLPDDPVAKPLTPSIKRDVEQRIRRNIAQHVANVEFYDARRPWRTADLNRYPVGTLCLLQRPDGMWVGHFKHSHGVQTSRGEHKGPVAAAKDATRNVVMSAAMNDRKMQVLRSFDSGDKSGSTGWSLQFQKDGLIEPHRSGTGYGGYPKTVWSLTDKGKALLTDWDKRKKKEQKQTEKQTKQQDEKNRKERLASIQVLYRQPDTLALWGVPYRMRRGQQPHDIPQQYRRDWIWLGQPGWWGSMSRDWQADVKRWLARHKSDLPQGPNEWSEV